MAQLANRDRSEKLSVIEREHPGASVEIVCLTLKKIQIAFKGQISDEEIVLSAENIMWKYQDLTVADMQFFVKELTSEKMFGELNVNKIVVAFTDFYIRRENACADWRELVHSKRKAKENNGFAKVDYKKMLAQVEVDKEAKIEAKKNRKPVINTQKFKAEDFEKKEL